MKILIVDDDFISMKLLTHFLNTMGHEIIACDNGVDAWRQSSKDHSIRFIISDWQMPGLNGIELCRRIRANKERDYVYFILLTAATMTKSFRTEAMMAGVDDFLEKPLDRDEVWMRLEVAQRILKYTQRIFELEKLLPICSYCKKIRNDDNYWEQVDTYFTQTQGTDFSHSICPECYERVILPELAKMREEAAIEEAQTEKALEQLEGN